MEPGNVDPRNEKSLKYARERDKTTLFSKSDLPTPAGSDHCQRVPFYRRREGAGPIAGSRLEQMLIAKIMLDSRSCREIYSSNSIRS
jgi:hypothetical protein